MSDEQPEPVTPGEKLADQMVRDISDGRLSRTERQVVRGALDKADAPPVGRDATDGAIGRISRGW